MRGALAATAVLLVACGAHDEPRSSATTHAALGGDTVARVGSTSIPASLVARVSSADRLDPRTALDHLVDDALAAEGARASAADRKSSVAWPIESLLARTTIDHVSDDTRAAGPPTDAELAAATNAHWRELDLPEQLRVIHVVVRRPANPADVDRARALASQIAASEANATDPDDFERRAKSFPPAGLDVLVQRLPAFVADGRTSEDEAGNFDLQFTKSAFALAKPGDTSGVVESSAGWHVIRLLERRSPHVVPLEERRALLESEIFMRRAHDALDTRLATLRGSTNVETMPDALELIGRVSAPQ